MSDFDSLAWLDAAAPHEPARSAAQIRGVRLLAGSAPKRIVDLGCGTGRVLGPLAEAGHEVVGIDCDQRALAHCEDDIASRRVNDRVQLVQGDFVNDWPPALTASPGDLILCLGNTFMLLADVRDALRVVRQAAATLKPGGLLLIDDIAHEFWPEVTEGYWQSGLSEDGALQMVWADDDAVFTIRTGEAVDEMCWHFTANDTRLRLWSMGALGLLAAAGGLSAPAHLARAGLLVLRRPECPADRLNDNPR